MIKTEDLNNKTFFDVFNSHRYSHIHMAGEVGIWYLDAWSHPGFWSHTYKHLNWLLNTSHKLLMILTSTVMIITFHTYWDYPPQFSAEVKTVQLSLYSPSQPSCPALGGTLSLPFIYWA